MGFFLYFQAEKIFSFSKFLGRLDEKSAVNSSPVL